MAGLPWCRMDTNLPQHDKILALLSDPSAKKWHAIGVYHFGIEWSVGTGTDGFIPQYALTAIHATLIVARLLVKYHLWDEGIGGWQIRNFDTRQQTTADRKTPEEIQQAQHIGGIKGNCVRHHGPDCGCWRDAV